ncbi:MAG: TIGR04149 family rSAM-modified RiPP [Agriterribacter sp.]
MKKLKLKLQDFEGAKMLTKEQLKRVMGGSDSSYPGGCCVHSGDWEGYNCGLSRSQADNLFDGGNGGWDNWCCDSCQDSWNNAH